MSRHIPRLQWVGRQGRNGGCVSSAGNRAYEGNNFLPRKYQNRCRAILPCDPKFFHPQVNALRTAKVHALPRVYGAALKLGLVICARTDTVLWRGNDVRVLLDYIKRATRVPSVRAAMEETPGAA